MVQPFRLLVIGSRTWDDAGTIEQALAVILGPAPRGRPADARCLSRGADAIPAAYAARTPGYLIEAHPADWRRYGRAAGYRRNAEMIALGADGCAAFVRGGSPGSTSAVRLARAAGITRLASHPALTDSDSFLTCLGATLGATRMNDLVVLRTDANSRQRQTRGRGLF